MHDEATGVVERFWELMNGNDWAAAAELLADDYVLDWPQSNERIRGRANFAAVNAEYPANGRWRFTVHRIVGGAGEAASDVSVTDGVQSARAVSFFTVRAGRIARMVEFWPEPYPAPANRAHLVERLEE
ncbi:MAG TPA: nuclear transport factor 2 family protein [Herpetosiphonaceae bacterium]|nr:nuclear transport factor 2 family protein [Herpetosiphonaceae bacterium]